MLVNGALISRVGSVAVRHDRTVSHLMICVNSICSSCCLVLKTASFDHMPLLLLLALQSHLLLEQRPRRCPANTSNHYASLVFRVANMRAPPPNGSRALNMCRSLLLSNPQKQDAARRAEGNVLAIAGNGSEQRYERAFSSRSSCQRQCSVLHACIVRVF